MKFRVRAWMPLLLLLPGLWAMYYSGVVIPDVIPMAPMMFSFGLLAILPPLPMAWSVADRHTPLIVTIPIPALPSRQRRLEKRLQKVLKIKSEVGKALLALPEDHTLAEALKARMRELEGAEETLKTEMVYDEIIALNKRAGKAARKEMK